MAGILIEYARFIEVRQRRARIGAELGEAHEPPPSRARVASIDEAVAVAQPRPAVDAGATSRVGDVR